MKLFDSWLVLSPILVPFAGAALLVFLSYYQRIKVQQRFSLVLSILQLPLTLLLAWRFSQKGILVMQASNWPAPFGISFVADALSVLMVVIVAMVGLAVNIYALSDIGKDHQRFAYHPLYQLLIAGLNGAFLTGDLFNLYVWFEILLISSFVLLSLGNDRAQIRGALSYVLLNLIASAFFLMATGMLYGYSGSLNLPI
ncbi:MAG: proton-conducting transporter membrane subunit [Deinococcales bacterium]